MEEQKIVLYLLMLGDGMCVYRREVKDASFNPTGLFNPFEPRTLDLSNMPRLEIVDSYLTEHTLNHVITLRCTNSKLPDFDALRKYDARSWEMRDQIEGFDLETAELALQGSVSETKTAAT